jgi:hypothetical protein
MGGRERRYDTEAFVFTSSGALTRQLPAAWLAGVILAFLLASAVAFRLLVAGDFGSLAALIAGALFVPSMALAAGVWSGGGKLFEILYTILWYVGPANRAAALDYSGATRTTPAGVAAQSPAVWFALAAFLLAAAFVGRLRRMRA